MREKRPHGLCAMAAVNEVELPASPTSCPRLNRLIADMGHGLALIVRHDCCLYPTTGTPLGSKQQRETFSSRSREAGAESPDDARIVQSLAALNSELANAQRELARRNSELAGVIREKNQLLGMAAHDLRNPLGIIVGVDMLNEELADSLSAENHELLSRVASSAEYMLGLIDDMLDYSKIDAGRLDLQLGPVNVADLIRQNIAFNSILANKKGINLRFACEGSQPILNLDSRRILQVLNNLISNALKFADSGTTVTVTLRSGAT